MTQTFTADNYSSSLPGLCAHTHSHVARSTSAASVQFLNGCAVTLRLMFSRPLPSACISVQLFLTSLSTARGGGCLRAAPYGGKKLQLNALFPNTDYVPIQNKKFLSGGGLKRLLQCMRTNSAQSRYICVCSAAFCVFYSATIRTM